MNEYGAYSPSDAKNYEQAREAEREWHIENAWIRQLVQQRQPREVLDVPIGTGRFIPYYGASSVVGVDLSVPMLQEASTKADRKSLHLVCGNVASLPFSDARFDLVVCWRLLHLLTPAQLAPSLREMRRVCGGVLCVQVYEQGSWIYRYASILKRILKRSFSSISGRTAARAWRHINVYSHTRRSLEDAFSSAGLEEPATHYLSRYDGTRIAVLVWDLTQ